MQSAPASQSTPQTQTATTLPVEQKGTGTQEQVTESLKTTEVPSKETTPEEKPDAKRFAELSRKQAQQRKADLELKKRQEELDAKEARLKALEELPVLFKTNPGEAFKRLNSSYEEVTENILANGKVTPERVQKESTEKYTTLEQRIEDLQNQLKARDNKETQKEIDAFRGQIDTHIKSNLDKYPTVTAFQGTELIFQMIQQRFEDTRDLPTGPHIMSIDEAAEILENDLDKIISPLMQAPKYASRFAPQPKQEDKKQATPGLSKPKTITNELTSSAPSLLPPQTEAERLRRALDKLA